MSDASAEDLAAFETALTSAQPGDTVTLPAGRYAGDFVATADGTSEAPVIFQAAAAARVVIDGSLTVNGDHVQFRNVEIIYSGWTSRESAEEGSDPTDIPEGNELNIFGVGTKLINAVVRDTANAVGLWASAVGAELYGVLVYNTGWMGPDRGHGHALYTQNATGTKLIRLCVFAQGYSEWGVHAYTEGGSIVGFTFEDTVHYASKWLTGGYTAVDDLAITRAHLRGGMTLGYDGGVTNGDAALTDVIATGSLQVIGNWGVGNARIVQTGCTFSAGGRNEVHIAANEYDDDRATVVVYNAALAHWIALDLSALPLTVRREYVLRNAQNYDEGYSFVYTGVPVAVPMTGWTVVTPIGASEPLTASTFPAFGTLLLEPA